MYILPEAIKDVLGRASDVCEIGCNSVFSEDGSVDPAELYFCMGVYEVVLFLHDHPIDHEEFSCYGIRDTNEVAVLIDKKRGDEVHPTYPTSAAPILIDVAGLISQRALTETLPLRMARVWWLANALGNTTPFRSIEGQIGDILEDLALLVQSPGSRRLAGELRQQYVTAHVQRPPFLAVDSPIPQQAAPAPRLPP